MGAARPRGTKRTVGRWLALAAGLVLSTLTLWAWAGGGKPATQLVNVADTRALSPGFVKFVGDTYNDSLVCFGLLVVGVMSGMGAGLGLLFDRGMAHLGINLGKLDHHE